MDEPEDAIREMVEPIDGAKAGDRVRYIQFTDSMYFAPATIRTIKGIPLQVQGADAGTLQDVRS